ncbi:hypothetical protein N7G274_009127 [Stereocaulon virgatum]|uniref:C2H2-type domain-containing protein n=1 Tax=Stereocaulon virgatum TaxID=373712 RepID=A0ABR4A058_9LECA
MTSTKKRLSGASQKRSNVPAGSLPSDGCHANQRSQNVVSTHGQDHSRNIQEYTHGGLKAHAPSTSLKNSNRSAAYNAARISRWAEDSATGPELPGNGTYSQAYSTYGDEIFSTSAASGSFSYLPPDAIQDQPASVYQPCGPNMHYFASNSTSSAEACLARMDIGQDIGFDFPVSYQGEQYPNGIPAQVNGQFDSLTNANELVRFDTMELHPSVAFADTNELPLSTGWETQLIDGFSGTNVLGTTQSAEWSSPTALTPSTSSLQSEHSFLEQQLETPVSANMQDVEWSVTHPMALATDFGTVPSMSVEEMQARLGHSYMDSESTLRPKQDFQRAPLSIDLWSNQETAAQAYGLPTYPGIPMSRRSSEGENRNARDHPFYKAEPDKDDNLYHCPDPNKEGCKKVEKLKCNYDKHLDSHLKPYRCKSQGCAQAVFSSTACLLRHEREAHSMHGHGNKPHLCHFQDCERAAEDNGFPRRWNLFDHMKRVHDYDPSNKSNSPSPSSSSPPPQDAPRKKRTPSPTEEGAKKRPRFSSSHIPQPSAPVPTGISQPPPQLWAGQSWEQVRSGHIAQMEDRLRTMDPTDSSALEQRARDYAILQSIDQNMLQQRAAQLAHSKESRL